MKSTKYVTFEGGDTEIAAACLFLFTPNLRHFELLGHGEGNSDGRPPVWSYMPHLLPKLKSIRMTNTDCLLMLPFLSNNLDQLHTIVSDYPNCDYIYLPIRKGLFTASLTSMLIDGCCGSGLDCH